AGRDRALRAALLRSSSVAGLAAAYCLCGRVDLPADGGIDSADAEAALQLRELAPADRQRLPRAQPQRIAVRAPFERGDVGEADEQAAVDADELVGELVLEALQRLVDHVLAAQMPHGHVLLLGPKVEDFLERDQAQLVANPGRDVPARGRAAVMREPVEERR